jgi:hypothetical protein
MGRKFCSIGGIGALGTDAIHADVSLPNALLPYSPGRYSDVRAMPIPARLCYTKGFGTASRLHLPFSVPAVDTRACAYLGYHRTDLLMNRPKFEDSDKIIKQIREENLSTAVSALDDPATALTAIDDWGEEWLAIIQEQGAKTFTFSKELILFIERTNYLAKWCESIGLDSSPLVQFAKNARETYFALRPTLPPVPDALWVLLDRLRFKLQPFKPKPSTRQQGGAKQPIPDDEANIAVRNFLKQHPDATAREVAKGVGIALGRVSGLQAWRAEVGRRKANNIPAPKPERRLTRKKLAAIGKKDDPSARLVAEEAAWQRLLEDAKPDERARLFALSKDDKAKLIQIALEQFAEELAEIDDDDCS